MAGRRASMVIRKIMDIMQFCQNNNKEALLLSLDYLKAFDRVELRSIQGSLEFFWIPRIYYKLD